MTEYQYEKEADAYFRNVTIAFGFIVIVFLLAIGVISYAICG